MFKILIETYNFLEEFCEVEIKSFFKGNIKKVRPSCFEISFDSCEILCEFLERVFYYSRTISRVSLDGEDLYGFDFLSGDYKINKGEHLLSSFVCNFLFYKLGMNKDKDFSVVDPLAGVGDLIIGCSLFKRPYNVKRRNEVLFARKFDFTLKIPEVEKVESKFVGIVQENSDFKKLKENISYSSSKIKVSQFGLDMLDVKFKEKQFDFVISNLGGLDFEELKEFFYMVEFIGKRVGVVCLEKVDKKVYQDCGLKLVSFDEIEFERKKYFVYVLK